MPPYKESLQVPGDPLEQSAVVNTSEPAESIPVTVATEQVQGSGTRDIFGTLLSEPAARLHAALDETIPKSLKTLREESGYQDVYNYIQKLLKEGKVRSVELRGNRTGYIIDPNWLKRVQDTLPTEKLPSAAVPPFPDEPLQEAEIIQSSTAVSSTGDTSKKHDKSFDRSDGRSPQESKSQNSGPDLCSKSNPVRAQTRLHRPWDHCPSRPVDWNSTAARRRYSMQLNVRTYPRESRRAFESFRLPLL